MKLLHPELFQGVKKLNGVKHYFEGWYFKLVTKDLKTIAFIPGISINKEDKHAFVQINYEKNSEPLYISFAIESFKFSSDKFEVSIDNNFFSREGIELDLKDQGIKGEIIFNNIQGIETNIFSPGIMGPFTFTPFMECYHGLINMNSETMGSLEIGNELINFDGGKGYLEKDWGKSFPKRWIWAQGNNFQEKDSAFVFSIAKIPWLFSSFDGFFSVLTVASKEYRFATYNGSKVSKLKIENETVDIEIKKGTLHLMIFIKKNSHAQLMAPNSGKMDRVIHESIDSDIEIKLYENAVLIYRDKSSACGCEIVNYK